ncbi:MAG: glycosyl hydrolase family 18 protein, partial [bacterium]
RSSNYTLSMASPAVDWSSAWDYDALADNCDWLFLMGYNYFYSGSPSAGPVAPLKLNSGWYLTRSVNDYLFKTKGDTSKVILGLPYYGIKWPVISNNGYSKTRGRGSSIFYKRAKSEVAGFGRKWDDTAKSPWYSYNSNGWFVAWYDDEVSLSHKYTMATDKGLLGVGIWALGYDDGFNELWQTLFNHFGATRPPKTPTRLRVETDVTRGDIVVSLKPDSGANGFDTDTGVVPANTHDYVVQYGESIKATGYTFNSTSNEAVESGEIPLTDYEIVIWILGNESVETNTLTSLEQARIKNFLKNGGKLFISGSNIGFDLVENGTSASNTFFSEYLKATYVKDNAVENSPAYTANPNTVENLFTGLGNINFDDGTQGTYHVDRPDGILPAPLSGSWLGLTYDGVDPDLNGGAGIAYSGTFEAGTLNGALVYFSFPFETITDAAMRDSVMARIFKFFSTLPTGIEHVETPEVPNAYSLAQNYPNPFNPGITIEFGLVKSSRVKLVVFNVLGQNVITLIDKDLTAGNYKVEWNGQDDGGQKVASGVYIYQLESEHFTARKKMLYLR